MPLLPPPKRVGKINGVAWIWMSRVPRVPGAPRRRPGPGQGDYGWPSVHFTSLFDLFSISFIATRESGGVEHAHTTSIDIFPSGNIVSSQCSPATSALPSLAPRQREPALTFSISLSQTVIPWSINKLLPSFSLFSKWKQVFFTTLLLHHAATTLVLRHYSCSPSSYTRSAGLGAFRSYQTTPKYYTREIPLPHPSLALTRPQ